MDINTAKLFGERLRQIRNFRGLTQADVGEIVEVGWQTISRWERGLRFPEHGQIDALCSHFRLNPGFFFETESIEEMDDQKALALIRKGLEFLELSQISWLAAPPSQASASSAEGSKHSHAVEGFGRIETSGLDDAEAFGGGQ